MRRPTPGAFWSGPWPVLLLTAVAAALRFGFSTDAGEALAGTLTVAVLWDAVRRAGGRAAALAAAAALALMPESLLASGSADAVVTLLAVIGLWLTVRGCETVGPVGRLSVGLAGLSIGLACAVRPVGAWLCAPALAVLYGFGVRHPARRRLADLALAVAAGLVVAGIGLIGFGGVATPARLGAGLASSGLLGLLKATGLHYDSVFGDVLVATVAVGGAALLRDRGWLGAAAGGTAKKTPTDTRPALALAVVLWIAIGLVAFAAGGMKQGRYLEAVAPALAIALGMGAARLAGFDAAAGQRRRPSTVGIALALGAVSAYAFHFGSDSTSWGSFALLESAVGAALLSTVPGRLRIAGRWLVAVLVVACSLAVPVHETLALVRAGASRTVGIAGIAPGAASSGGGSGLPLLGPVVSVQVTPQEAGQPLPRGFLGFSFEYPALQQYAGTDPAAINPVLLALIRALNPAGSPVLRIGGDSSDHTWWPEPGVQQPGGVDFSLSPAWMQTARALADDLGGRLILGLNLAADDPALAAAEARAMLVDIGSQDIAALEIGNEADVYKRFAWYRAADGRVYFARPHSYDLTGFIEDFDRWRAMIPPAPLAGPAFARPGWMAGLSRFLADEPGLRLVTFHRYPTRGCESNSSDATYASIPHLMSNMASGGLARQVAGYVATAHAAGLPFRLDELNSASCRGKPGVSDTFASSLWVLDTLFNLAAVGVDGVNIHTLPGAPYEPFAFNLTGTQWSASIKPLYYGLLMFARAFPTGARLLSLHTGSSRVHAWATEAPDGRVRVVLINDDPTSAVTVRLSLPGPPRALAAQALQAPSLSATSGVTLGGESFGADTTTGVLPQNPHEPRILPLLGAYLVNLPPASAVMLSR